MALRNQVPARCLGSPRRRRGVDVRGAGLHELVDPEPLHVADRELRLEGQIDRRTDAHRQDHHVTGKLAAVGHDARHALVAEEPEGLLPGDHRDPEVLDPLADDLGGLRIEYGRHHLAELFQEGRLDPPAGQADAGLHTDGTGADDHGPLTLHVVDLLGVRHGLEGRDPLLVDAGDGRHDGSPARGEQDLVKGVLFPVGGLDGLGGGIEVGDLHPHVGGHLHLLEKIG